MTEPQTADQPFISINVGPLRGLASLCLFVAEGLQEFSEKYSQGYQPNVAWDMRHVEYGRMSLAGLTAFVAIADRLRTFCSAPPEARVRYNPKIFAFWSDINLLSIVRENDLLSWNPPIGGYGEYVGMTNPNTELLLLREPAEVPSWEDTARWSHWKDQSRQRLTNRLLKRCASVFQVQADHKLVETIAQTTAELALNAQYWGRSAACIGMQRSTVGTSVCVCDVGRGFLATLTERASKCAFPTPGNHLEAAVLASIVNRKDFGLRQAIDLVVSSGGWVTISCFDAEIRWGSTTWNLTKTILLNSDLTEELFRRIIAAITQIEMPKTSDELRKRGYWRSYNHGVRGVRITFETP